MHAELGKKISERDGTKVEYFAKRDEYHAQLDEFTAKIDALRARQEEINKGLHEVEERRLANDGRAYARREFLAFYGRTRGPRMWHAASPRPTK